MKRMAVLWLLFLALFILAFPGYADVQEEAYDTIQHLYEEAEKKETEFNDLEGATDELSKLKTFYEAEINTNPQINEFKLSALYYDYAVARVELQMEKPDYRKAEELLQKCKDSLYLGNAYYLFAQGMRESEDQLFSSSHQHLSEIGTALPEYYQRIQTAIQENQLRYKESLRDQGAAECGNGNHEKAQELYKEYLDIYPSDTEIRLLLNDCIDTHGETLIIQDDLNISGLKYESEQLSWENGGSGPWCIQIFRDDDLIQEIQTSERENQIDLMPGFNYSAHVADEMITFSIEKPEPYDKSDCSFEWADLQFYQIQKNQAEGTKTRTDHISLTADLGATGGRGYLLKLKYTTDRERDAIAWLSCGNRIGKYDIILIPSDSFGSTSIDLTDILLKTKNQTNNTLQYMICLDGCLWAEGQYEIR